MAKVTFNGTLLDENEGTFEAMPGVYVAKARGFEPIARGTGVLARDLAATGTQHAVLLRFRGVSASAILSRLRTAYNSGQGTLSMTGFTSIPNCYLLPPPPLTDVRTAARVTGSSRDMGFTVALVFMQVEP